MLAKAIRRGNYCVVGWSIRSFDTVTKDREKLLRRVTNSLRNGDIILFHDYSEATRQMLPELIKYILTIGVKIVSLDTLLNENAYRQPVK